MFLIGILIIFSLTLVSADFGYDSTTEDFGYDSETETRDITYINQTNRSEYWITNDGDLENIDTTQFNNNAGTLEVVQGWWDNLYCQLTGCTMEGNIAMGGNDISDAGDIFADSVSIWDTTADADGVLSIYTHDASNSFVATVNDAGSTDLYSADQYQFRSGDDLFQFIEHLYTGTWLSIDVSNDNPEIHSESGIVNFTDEGIITTNNITASYFKGDGSELTGLLKDTGDTGTGNFIFNQNFTVDTNTFFVDSNSNKVGIGTTSPSYPLEVSGSSGGVSIYAQYNISATDYITRTSVFDTSKTVWDYIKDADYYIDSKSNEINHSKFYGYRKYKINVTDYDKPVEEEQVKKVCEDVIVGNETVQECSNETEIITTYPYKKEITEEGVSLSSEIDLLRQANFELKNRVDNLEAENQLIKSELCLKDNSYSWC